LMAVVVFPTPPFWLATAITHPMYVLGEPRVFAEYFHQLREGNAGFVCRELTWTLP
jgi:hypothetical protein